MANMNKVILIGRLTRDVETRAFSNGGMVAKFGFAVTNRKKNTQTGQWEDEPMFIDCEAFNRGETGKLADMVRDRVRKGSQLMIEGKLHFEQWDDKTTGAKRSKHKLVVDNIQFLDPRTDGGNMGGGNNSMDDDMGGSAPPPRRMPPQNTMSPPANSGYSAPADDGPDNDGGDIPF
jgi:single-strand DNA-binding protein